MFSPYDCKIRLQQHGNRGCDFFFFSFPGALPQAETSGTVAHKQFSPHRYRCLSELVPQLLVLEHWEGVSYPIVVQLPLVSPMTSPKLHGDKYVRITSISESTIIRSSTILPYLDWRWCKKYPLKPFPEQNGPSTHDEATINFWWIQEWFRKKREQNISLVVYVCVCVLYAGQKLMSTTHQGLGITKCTCGKTQDMPRLHSFMSLSIFPNIWVQNKMRQNQPKFLVPALPELFHSFLAWPTGNGASPCKVIT